MLAALSHNHDTENTCRIFKVFIVWISLKDFDWDIWCYLPATVISDLMRNTPMVLDMTTNNILHEPLARSDNYLKQSNFL